jgi:hypothetical protein
MFALLGCAVFAGGCATHSPNSSRQFAFMERAQTQMNRKVAVTVAVPSADEAGATFGAPLDRKGIQPVWVRIENGDDIDYIFLPADMDANYFFGHRKSPG